MEWCDSIFLKSIFQAGIGLFSFVALLIALWLVKFLLQSVLGINLIIVKDDLNLVLIILATIGTATYVYNSESLRKEKENVKKQMDLLKILHSELDFLDKNLEAYKETFSKESHYPFYELWGIDISLYFKGLSHKINNQETLDLKKNLMIIKDKLLIINNMKFEARKWEEERSQEKVSEYAIKTLRTGIIKIISEDILPVIKKSKEFLDNPLLK